MTHGIIKKRLDKNNKNRIELFMESGGIRELDESFFVSFTIQFGQEYQVEYEIQRRKVDGKTLKCLIIYKADRVIYCQYPGFVDIFANKGNETSTVNEKFLSNINSKIIQVNPSTPAIAPYNFVPLDSSILPSANDASSDLYDKNLLSGTIELKIILKTPIYIRDMDSLEDFVKKQKTKSNKPINSNFFNVNGTPRIPGSSIRGMVRTLLEIVTSSKMHFVDDKNLYFRKFMNDSKKLIDNYNRRFVKSEKYREGNYNYLKIRYKFEAGYLKKEKNGEYKVYPAKINSIDKFQYYRVHNSKVNGSTWKNRQEVYFTVEPVSPSHDARNWYQSMSRRNIKIECAIVDNISTFPSSGARKGVLIKSGLVGHNKHYQWILNERDSNSLNSIEVPLKVIDDYRNDISRDSEWDLLDAINKGEEYVPCFYTTFQQNAKTFVDDIGHTGFSRVRFKNSIRQHINNVSECQEKKDFVESLFGIVNHQVIAGRVRFDDCIVDDSIELSETDSDSIPKILSAPKPTSFQLYLQQDNEHQDELKDYNEANPSINGSIRGYKLYWHKKNANWKVDELGKQLLTLVQENGIEITKFQRPDKKIYLCDLPEDIKSIIIKLVKESADEKHYTVIKPIANRNFRGKIRFENITKEELGALLFILDLPEMCCHKIGMGKPLGLGSIKIISELNIIFRHERYNLLGIDWKRNCSESINLNKENTLDDYKKCYAELMLNQRNMEKVVEKLWETRRYKELYRLLHWPENEEQNIWNENRTYAELAPGGVAQNSQFARRHVLPKPTDVLPDIGGGNT